MESTVAQLINGIPDPSARNSLRKLINAIADRKSCIMITTAALVIKAGASALVKTGAAFYAVVEGKLVTKAAATDMAALAGTVLNATFNVFVYYMDSAGTLSTQMGTAGATLGQVTFPPTPERRVIIGFTIINPTGAGSFVGGTTAIDDAGVVPNAVHLSITMSFDPTILLG